MIAQTEPDLQKLRRFALAIGLVLITYSIALEFDPGEGVRPLGLPFKVVRPELLPIGLILASVYGAVRFWYYGTMKGESPARHRQRLVGKEGFDSQFRANRTIVITEEQRKEFTDQFQKFFPKVFGSSIWLDWKKDPEDADAEDAQKTLGYADLARNNWSRSKVVKSHVRRSEPCRRNGTTPKRSFTSFGKPTYC